MAPKIETPRLVLRGWKDADIEPWVAMNADPEVMRFFPAPLARDQSETQAARIRRDLETKGYGWWIVELKDTAEFAGVTALLDVESFQAPFTPARDIGWRFRSEVWGTGYATEAAEGVVAFTSEVNLRSQRVMQRLGMMHDPRDDFDHPRIEEHSPLRRQVLYRKNLHPSNTARGQGR